MSFSVFLAILVVYPWPIAPMNQQHNISGTFGEFRHGPPIHYHNAVDIPAPEGTPVYAVQGGEVLWLGSGFNGGIRVGRFAYVHVYPRSDLQLGDTVGQGEVVGYINSGAHVHFKDGGGSSTYPLRNPLMPDAIQPFNDPWGTSVYSVTFFSHYLGNRMDADSLYGRVDIVAGALDTTGSGTIGSNNGIFSIYYALMSGDTQSVIVGPHRLVEFEYLPPAPVDEVYYAPWSNNQHHYYIVTNTGAKGVGSLNLTHIPEGDYVLIVYANDARDNWDTSYTRIHVVPADTTPPKVPELLALYTLPDGRGVLRWKPDTASDLAGYKLYLRFNNSGWIDWATISSNDSFYITDRPLVPNWNFYFKLTAFDNQGNESGFSTTFVIRRTNSPDSVLIVDGNLSEKGHSFYERYLEGLENITVKTISEKTLESYDLTDYSFIILSKGADSSGVDTSSLMEYLAGGGKLFINGSNVAKTLRGSGFLRYLGAVFVSDTSMSDTVLARPCGPFFDLSGVILDDNPDVIDTVNLGFAVFSYSDGGTAGVINGDSSAFFFSFSVDHASDDSFVVSILRIVRNFYHLTGVSESSRSTVFLEFSPDGTIHYNLPGRDLMIFDVTGRLVRSLKLPSSSGTYRIRGLKAGVYIFRIDDFSGKFLIVR